MHLYLFLLHSFSFLHVDLNLWLHHFIFPWRTPLTFLTEHGYWQRIISHLFVQESVSPSHLKDNFTKCRNLFFWSVLQFFSLFVHRGFLCLYLLEVGGLLLFPGWYIKEAKPRQTEKAKQGAYHWAIFWVLRFSPTSPTVIPLSESSGGYCIIFYSRGFSYSYDRHRMKCLYSILFGTRSELFSIMYMKLWSLLKFSGMCWFFFF